MNMQELFRLDDVPVYQNKMFETVEAGRACPRGSIVLVQDFSSGFIFNQAFEPDKLDYDESYQNEQGLSPAFRNHIKQVMELVGRRFRKMAILEIGCGKGTFVEMMRAEGYRASGIDPAYEGNSDYIIRRHFDSSLGIHGEAIVMRHLLEHIPDPFQFLSSVCNANGGSGLIYIEVPCLEWILDHKAWFDVFYEHVNYFCILDFFRMFGHVLESGHLFGGQYLYIIADIASLRDPRETELDAPKRIYFGNDFFAGLDRCAQLAHPGVRRAIWGAGAKGVMFAHHMGQRGLALELVIDINPAKQNKFLAGCGLPVVSAQEAISQLGENPDIFVMNSNYISEIQTMGGLGPNYISVDQI